MKTALFIFTLSLFCLASCRKQRMERLEGNYTGIFYRTAPAVDYRPAQVSLTLDNNMYSGASAISKYPAICRGKWQADRKAIQFTNECPWTAEFDWSFILDGEYKYELDGSHLKIWKEYSNNRYDTYELQKN